MFSYKTFFKDSKKGVKMNIATQSKNEEIQGVLCHMPTHELYEKLL